MLHLYVKDLAGTVYLTEPNNDVLILAIKRLVSEIKKEYEIDLQELFVPDEKNEPIVLDDCKKLSDYGLGHESTIYIFIHPCWKKMMEDIMKGRYNLSHLRDKGKHETLCAAYQHALLTPEEADSECMIGLFYREKERYKAVEWFEKAVEKDHVASSYFLGECYYYGIGVEKNFFRASELLHFSAERDYVPAQLLLAQYYEKIGGIYRDVAKLWLKRAGNREAKKLLKNM